MNIEICKKCDEGCVICFNNNKVNHHIIVAKIFMSDKAEMILDSEKIFYHDNKNWLCIKDKIKNIDYYIPEEKDFNEIKLDKNCPFYIEHELYDWNQKNES